MLTHSTGVNARNAAHFPPTLVSLILSASLPGESPTSTGAQTAKDTTSLSPCRRLSLGHGMHACNRHSPLTVAPYESTADCTQTVQHTDTDVVRGPL